MPAREKTVRIRGYDIARSLAILGMVVVHFSLVMAEDASRPKWLAAILGFLDGRAAAMFVTLAGIGITLSTQRAVAIADADAIADARRTLVRRGLFLLILGFINLTVWPGDILRVYGISLMLAAQLITASSRQLLIGTISCAAGFLISFIALDFEQNWEWDTLSYRGLWTPNGIIRNLFYDGFRSVLPWTGFVLFGMWLGRHDLRNRTVNNRVLRAAILVALAAELVSWACVRYFLAHPQSMTPEDIRALFGTESMPALPLFLLAGGGTAVFVIAFCVRLAENWPGRWWNPLAATGQMALTWYMAHIVLGLGTVVELGLEASTSLAVAATTGLLFFVAAVIVSWFWKLRFRHGPLEWVLRTLAG